jgi:hypothetical protein
MRTPHRRFTTTSGSDTVSHSDYGTDWSPIAGPAQKPTSRFRPDDLRPPATTRRRAARPAAGGRRTHTAAVAAERWPGRRRTPVRRAPPLPFPGSSRAVLRRETGTRRSYRARWLDCAPASPSDSGQASPAATGTCARRTAPTCRPTIHACSSTYDCTYDGDQDGRVDTDSVSSLRTISCGSGRPPAST